jgi:sodium-dependent dicarboxylate transporter 2/3/5
VSEGNRQEPLNKSVGLVAGFVGFVGLLLAPQLAALAPAVLRSFGLVLLIASLVAMIAGRRRRRAVVVATAVVCLAITFLLVPQVEAMPREARVTLAVTVLMASWWMTVAIPIPATSLLPLVLLPTLGVLPSGQVAANYSNNIIFLFMGGFILALGIQRWNLHRRIALHVVRIVGTNPARMVLGFMLATAFLSMWISNTATTLMMLPIALAVIGSLREVSQARLRGFAPALLLGVAYSASIGGLATPIGTPPNLSFLRILQILYPGAPDIAFGRWFLAFMPLVLVFLPTAWLLLTRLAHKPPRRALGAGTTVIEDELRKLGSMSGAERRMLWIFTATALLWISRGDLDLGAVRIPGWAGLLEGVFPGSFVASFLNDATVAVAMAVLTFIVPGEPDDEGGRQALMNWQTAVELPWGILLLFGGGFSLALAFKESGLSHFLGEAFAGHIGGLPPLLLVVAACLLLTFLTEVTSNTATTEVMLPVLSGTAGAMGIHPLLLMLPATLSASCAFMLPIATPPNAIVFGSGEVEMKHMVRAGILLNLVGVVLITTIFFLISSRLLGLDLASIPAWAAP